MSSPRKPAKILLPAWARTKGLGSSAKSEIDRWIQEDEVRKLLTTARHGAELWAALSYDAFVLMANLGLRVGEIVQLQPADFSLLSSHNAVNVRTLKKRRSQPVTAKAILQVTPGDLARFQAALNRPLAAKPVMHTIYVGNAEKKALAPVVDRRIRAMQDRPGRDPRLFPHSKRYIQYHFDFYRARAGLRVGLSPHALRRFVATRIATITGDPRMAAKRLRHSEDVTMAHYIQYSPEKQIALLNAVRPIL